jgi:hypothetical protein
MKKSQMVRKVLRKLKEWEGSKMETKTAVEVIDLMIENGMLPPDQCANEKAPCDIICEWESEGKKK